MSAAWPVRIRTWSGNRWVHRALLAILLVWFFAWDLRAVLRDNRPGTLVSDTTLVDLLVLEQRVQDEGFGSWAAAGNVKGPLAALMAWPLDGLVGDPLLAVRLLSVLLHPALLLLLFALARRVCGGCQWTGLWAVLICGSFPAQFGWFRLDFHEPLVAVALVGTLVVMTMDPLASRMGWLGLGLAAGLGLLTKLSYPVFVVGPGLGLLAARLRDPRGLLRALAAVAVAAGVAAFWLVPSWREIMLNLGDSSHSETTWLFRLKVYFIDLPGTLPLAAASILGAGVCWFVRPRSRRALGLLVACSLVALLLLVLVFDHWTRYIVPLFPVAALLCAGGLTGTGALVARLGGPWLPRALGAALAVTLLLVQVHFNFKGMDSPVEPREFFAGMVAPDTRPYQAFSRAADLVKRQGWPVLELPSGPNPQAFPELYLRRGLGCAYIQVQEARARLAAGEPVALIFSHLGGAPLKALVRELGQRLGMDPEEEQQEGKGGAVPDPKERFRERLGELEPEQRGLFQLLLNAPTRLVRQFTDPDGVSYSVLRLGA